MTSQIILPYSTPPADLDEALIRALAAVPMGLTRELAAMLGRNASTVGDHLRTLADDGHVLHARIGTTTGSFHRWWLRSAVFQRLKLPAYYHNTNRGMTITAARIGAVDLIYQLAMALDLFRPDHAFQWHSQRAYDAVAGRPDHWVALFWIGIWEDAAAIRSRIFRLGHDLSSDRWPHLMAFVVPDHWQARVLQDVLDDLHLASHACVLVAADGTWAIPPPVSVPKPSAGWPLPPIPQPPPKLSARDHLLPTLDEGLYLGSTGSAVQKILPLLEQWPGILPTHIRTLLLNRMTGSQLTEVLHQMQRVELAVRDDRAWYPGPAAWTRAAHRDRVPHRRPAARLGATAPDTNRRRRRRPHEWATAKIVAHFQQQGCHIAPGWRAVDDAGPAGKVDPDAVIYLKSGPYGPGWHYLEYERRAQTSAAIAHKLRSGFMAERSNDWPFIFVVANEDAERLFWEHGQPLRLITAVDAGRTVPQRWRCYGVPVMLNGQGLLN